MYFCSCSWRPWMWRWRPWRIYPWTLRRRTWGCCWSHGGGHGSSGGATCGPKEEDVVALVELPVDALEEEPPMVGVAGTGKPGGGADLNDHHRGSLRIRMVDRVGLAGSNYHGGDAAWGVVKGLTAYDYINASNRVDVYSLLKPAAFPTTF